MGLLVLSGLLSKLVHPESKSYYMQADENPNDDEDCLVGDLLLLSRY